MPAPELFPYQRISEACDEILANSSQTALQYSTTEGYLPLREMLSRHASRYGIHAHPEHILITSGSQQALDLLGKLFINPGDKIVVESPTYLGALQAFNVYGADYIGVPIDEDGIKVDGLEAALRAGPKFIYLLPNFQNPSGVTMSLKRRREVVALADRYGVPIIEDDPYGQLRYEGKNLPPLQAIDRDSKGVRHLGDGGSFTAGNVIYLCTLSKTLAPGLRVAWVVAPPTVINKLVQLKQGTDLHTSAFNQMIAHHAARNGFLDQHILHLRKVYAERRDLMNDLLAQHFSPSSGVTWTRPQGGLFLWLKFPTTVDTRVVLKRAIDEAKVAFVPGSPFFPPETPASESCHYARLNFSNATPDKIQEGILRLKRIIDTL